MQGLLHAETAIPTRLPLCARVHSMRGLRNAAAHAMDSLESQKLDRHRRWPPPRCPPASCLSAPAWLSSASSSACFCGASRQLVRTRVLPSPDCAARSLMDGRCGPPPRRPLPANDHPASRTTTLTPLPAASLQVFRFLNSKSESLFLQRKNPRKISWTVVYRRMHKKGITEEVAKKRSRKNVKHQVGGPF